MNVMNGFCAGYGIATCKGFPLHNTVVELLRMFISFLRINLVLRVILVLLTLYLYGTKRFTVRVLIQIKSTLNTSVDFSI